MKRVWVMGLACLLAAASSAPGKESPASPAGGRGGADPRARAGRIGSLNLKLYDLLDHGLYDQALPVARQVLQLAPASGEAWYNLARVQARLGRRTRAVGSFDRAVDCGFCDFRRLEHDGALECLHGLDGYAKILQRNAGAQRARAERIGRQLRRRFGDDYAVLVDHDARLVLATNADPHMLSEVRKYLAACAEAMWRDLFDHPFEQYVTIVLPAGVVTDLDPGVGGYYEHARRLLLARQMGKVMTHEFTHALHAADQDALDQIHPIWVAEGLATMFESSAIEDRRVAPEPNCRLTLLKWILQRGATVRWRRMVAFDRAEFLDVAAVSYPQCRYMMMYLYDRGLLEKWYDAFTAGYDRDPTGATALEEVFGKPLEQIESEWKQWVRSLEPPPVRLRADSAYMGVEATAMADGLLVVAVLDGSGAAAAGLRPGDVIVGIDGKRVADGPKLLRLVTAKGVGATLQVRFRRDGKYLTAPVALGRWKGGPAPATADAAR